MRAYLLLAAFLPVHAATTDSTATTSVSVIEETDIPTFVTLTLYRAHTQLSVVNATAANSSGLVVPMTSTAAPGASTGAFPLCNSTDQTALSKTYTPTSAAPTGAGVEGLGTSGASATRAGLGFGLMVAIGAVVGVFGGV